MAAVVDEPAAEVIRGEHEPQHADSLKRKKTPRENHRFFLEILLCGESSHMKVHGKKRKSTPRSGGVRAVRAEAVAHPRRAAAKDAASGRRRTLDHRATRPKLQPLRHRDSLCVGVRAAARRRAQAAQLAAGAERTEYLMRSETRKSNVLSLVRVRVAGSRAEAVSRPDGAPVTSD